MQFTKDCEGQTNDNVLLLLSRGIMHSKEMLGFFIFYFILFFFFFLSFLSLLFQMANVCWWFFFSKVIELLDTVGVSKNIWQ